MGETGREVMDGVHLVHDNVQWWSLTNMVMDLGFRPGSIS